MVLKNIRGLSGSGLQEMPIMIASLSAEPAHGSRRGRSTRETAPQPAKEGDEDGTLSVRIASSPYRSKNTSKPRIAKDYPKQLNPHPRPSPERRTTKCTEKKQSFSRKIFLRFFPFFGCWRRFFFLCFWG